MSNPHKISNRWLLWWAVVGFWLLSMACLLARCAHGAERDYGRTCLALVGYSEARSDGLLAMVAVERVVLNRLASHRWGESICDVAMAPGQFEGVDRWPYPRIPREADAWAAANLAAALVLAGVDLPPSCGHPVYFSQVKPPQPLCKIMSHWFSI